MIVDDLDVVNLCVGPSKADTKLVIDANGVNTFSIAGERFEAVTGRAAQVFKALGGVKYAKFTARFFNKIG